MAYCDPSDILIGSNFPLPVGVSAAQYVTVGADEIDAKLGRLYKTPILFTTAEDQTKYASTIKLLKQLNQFIATGRLIMAIAIGGEDSQVHAYAKSLIDQAGYYIDEIVKGEIVLEGADANDNAPGLNDLEVQRPMVYQLDQYSSVEAFYTTFTNPTGGFLRSPVKVGPADDADSITITDDGFPQLEE